MHPLILEAGRLGRVWARAAIRAPALVSVLASTTHAATPPKPATSACPAPQAAVQEFFMPADCADCWAAPAGAAASAWRFDWIIPAADSAPLAAGALAESADRAARTGQSPARAGSGSQAIQRQAARPPLSGLQMRMESGPAWQGYFGTQLTLRLAGRPGATQATRARPAGSTAWLALVELVRAGSNGTPVARALVRSVAGPLPLTALAPNQTMTHLRALRWPASAEPLHLQARAWIEGPDGQLLAVVADRCPPR